METTKTLTHNGIEIRRSNEMANLYARKHLNPLMWVIEGAGQKHAFKTLKQAQQFIDNKIASEATQAHSDWNGNCWIIRPVDGKFTEVAISREELKAIREGAK